ncbi:MAG: hypothetical protein OEY11_15200, partial [Gammaproteobacteria bacterium]|nr:hypothetical protein [Gammaproteobacteria bacterium]
YQVFLGKFLGFSMLAFFISFIFFTSLVLFAEPVSVLIWSLSLWCELSLVALIALLFILSLQNIALSLMASISVYSLMRFMPSIQSMGDGPFQDSVMNRGMNAALDVIDLVLPRLDHFAQSSWLVYGRPDMSVLVSLLIEFILFVSLFVVVGVIDLKRKPI